MDKITKLKRLSPHNLESEKATLGAILVSEKARMEVFSILTPDDFYNLSHRQIFSASETMYLAGEKIDSITIADYLDRINKLEEVGGKLYLHELMASITAPSMGLDYAKAAKRHSDLRIVQKAAYDIYIRVQENRKEDIDEFKSWAQDIIFKATMDKEKEKVVKLSSFSDDFNSDLQKREKTGGGIVGISSGFSKLDKSLSGFQKGKLYIIAARTSVGKSSFALNILLEASKNDSISLLFSLEENWFEIYKKLTSINSEIDGRDLENGKISSHKEKLEESSIVIIGLGFYYYNSMVATIEDIKRYVKETKYKYGLDLVVVDYIQLVTSSEGDNREQKVASVARGLKEIASENEVAVIGLSQFNRNVKDNKKPNLVDLRESGAIEQDADVVIALSRLGEYDHINNYCKIEVSILKNRSGSLGRFKLDFYGKYTKFYQTVENERLL